MSNESINNEINVGALSEAINEKMDRNLVNADTIGQAILDRKVEVEALLEQNGYAKFTWKEDNKVASLIIQWGSAKMATNVTLPTSYSNANYTLIERVQTTVSSPAGPNIYYVGQQDISFFYTNVSTDWSFVYVTIG